MARRKRAEVREIIADAKYNDVMLTKFINYIMLDGKKSVVEQAVYSALENIKKSMKEEPLTLFHKALENITPKIEVRSRRVGGATYQVPVSVPKRRATALALKWLTISVRRATGKGLDQKVASALKEAVNESGWAFKKKEEVFRMAEANKAFSHFSW